MKYIKVKWIHPPNDDPVFLYSELNEANLEIRKVEIYGDGSYGFAVDAIEHNGTSLSTDAVPSMVEIENQPEFEPSQISKDDFENIWSRAQEVTRQN